MTNEVRLYRYLCQNEGWQHRDKIMHWSGYRSPKQSPVIAYVEFENDLIRLNSRLVRSGKRVVRGAPEGSGNFRVPEFYRIVSVDQIAA